MVRTGGENPIALFALGFIALLWGALGVQYSKRLEVGTRSHPRSEPNPYHELVRFFAALLFFGGLYLIAWSAWLLLTRPPQ